MIRIVCAYFLLHFYPSKNWTVHMLLLSTLIQVLLHCHILLTWYVFNMHTLHSLVTVEIRSKDLDLSLMGENLFGLNKGGALRAESVESCIRVKWMDIFRLYLPAVLSCCCGLGCDWSTAHWWEEDSHMDTICHYTHAPLFSTPLWFVTIPHLYDSLCQKSAWSSRSNYNDS